MEAQKNEKATDIIKVLEYERKAKMNWKDVFFAVPIVILLSAPLGLIGYVVYKGDWWLLVFLAVMLVLAVWITNALDYFSKKYPRY